MTAAVRHRAAVTAAVRHMADTAAVPAVQEVQVAAPDIAEAHHQDHTEDRSTVTKFKQKV